MSATRVAGVAAYGEQHGQLPHYYDAGSAGSLGIFLGKQRHAHMCGTLLLERYARSLARPFWLMMQSSKQATAY